MQEKSKPNDCKSFNKPSERATRTTTSRFWKTQCFFCCKKLTKNSKLFYSVKIPAFSDTILRKCEARLNMIAKDSWALEMKEKFSTCFDLVSAGARYHKNCRLLFVSGQKLKENGPVGRPKLSEKISAFEEGCSWLENETDFHTLSEFAEKVEQLSETGETYCRRHLKHLLNKKYGQYIKVTSVSEGRDDIISFQNTVQYLIEEKYKADKNGSILTEKERMTRIVGSAIRQEICHMKPNDVYPSQQDLSDKEMLSDWVPPSLKMLLEIIITNREKQIAIGHAITSACKLYLRFFLA